MATAPLCFAHHWVPPEPGGPSVTLLLLHGTGGDENDLLPWGSALARGAGLLSPRGQVREGGSNRFFRRFAEGVFDEADIRRRAAELADFVGHAADRYGFDRGNVCAVGYSNGANIAAAVLLLHPGALAGGLLYRAMLPLHPDPLPELPGSRVLLSAGRADPLVSAGATEELARLLRAAGGRVTLEWRDAGHGLVPADIEAGRRWLATDSGFLR